MNDMSERAYSSKKKEPIPIDRKKLRKTSIINKIKIIFSIILIIIILLLVSAYYIYSIPYTSVIIDANCSVNLKLNKWNKVINAYGLDTNGNTLLNNTNLKFKNTDDALIIIINKAEADNFIKLSSNDKKSSVTIYISGSPLELPNFYKEAKSKNYDIQINENGTEKFNNFKKLSSID